MIIRSGQKKIQHTFDIKFTNKDGSSFSLEKKDHIKYLGVLIDEKLTWKNQISYICSRISKNTEIFLQLRRYLSLKQLKQLYCTLICPYINYAIIFWGNASTSNLKKIKVKQNHIVRLQDLFCHLVWQTHWMCSSILKPARFTLCWKHFCVSVAQFLPSMV